MLTRESPDGEEGYPGTLAVELTVSLSPSGSLRLRYQAKTDKKPWSASQIMPISTLLAKAMARFLITSF
jgi:Galactose mutarotase and related enzymes